MFEEVKNATRNLSSALFSDSSDFVKKMQYKRFKEIKFNSVTRENVTSFELFEINCIQTEHSVHSALQSTAEVQAGSTFFIIRGGDAPSGMSLKDVIMPKDESEKFSVVSIDPIMENLFYAVSVESSKV